MKNKQLKDALSWIMPKEQDGQFIKKYGALCWLLIIATKVIIWMLVIWFLFRIIRASD